MGRAFHQPQGRSFSWPGRDKISWTAPRQFNFSCRRHHCSTQFSLLRYYREQLLSMPNAQVLGILGRGSGWKGWRFIGMTVWLQTMTRDQPPLIVTNVTYTTLATPCILHHMGYSSHDPNNQYRAHVVRFVKRSNLHQSRYKCCSQCMQPQKMCTLLSLNYLLG